MFDKGINKYNGKSVLYTRKKTFFDFLLKKYIVYK